MDDNNDFIMRQVKSFAEGLGVVINNKDGSKSQIVFEQQQGQSGTIKDEINKLLLQRKFEKAVQCVFEQKFIMESDKYVELARWLLNRFNSAPNVDEKLKLELINSINKVSRIKKISDKP